MPLREWLDNGWLKPHVPTRREMVDLLAIPSPAVSVTAGGVQLHPNI